LETVRSMITPYVKGLNSAAVRLGWDALRCRFDEQVGILSLSEDPHNLLMWSHYADSHRGVVLQFDRGHPFFDQRLQDEDPIRHLRPVTYQADRPTIRYFDPNADFQTYFLDMCASVFLTKGRDWRYEREWRIMLPLAAAASSPAPTLYLFEFPPEALTGIAIGARANNSVRIAVEEALANPPWQHVRTYHAQVSRTSFAVEIPDLA
jgi:hypothetical protein